MSIRERLRRLEAVTFEERLRQTAKQLAEQHGSDVEEELANLSAIYERITRHGMDGEIRLMARESGKSEAEVRAAFDEELVEIRREKEAAR